MLLRDCTCHKWKVDRISRTCHTVLRSSTLLHWAAVSTRGKCRCLPRYCRCTCSISRNQEDAPRRLPPPPTAFRVRVSELNRSFIARGFSSVPLQIKPYHRGAAELVRCCQDSEANTFQTLFIMSATAGRTPLLSHANPTSIHALITSPNGCFV